VERLRDGLLKGKIRCAPYLDGAIIALPRFEKAGHRAYLCGKIFQRGVECNSFDMTLMRFDSFYLF